MRNLSFDHIKDFHHQHFPEAGHEFMDENPAEFLSLVASDLANEASDQAAAQAYMRRHQQPLQYEPNSSPDYEAAHNNRRLSEHEQRQQRRQAMPKHMYINDQYRSSMDSGQSCLPQSLPACLSVCLSVCLCLSVCRSVGLLVYQFVAYLQLMSRGLFITSVLL